MSGGDFEIIIGLEVHAQLKTKSKIFCGCASEFGAEPNTNVCPVCLGLPGALPVLNREAVNQALKVALALECEINRRSAFARKNYFYPDLPKGYQISQYDKPLAQNGKLGIPMESGEVKWVRVVRVHLEEDAGKLIHGESESYVDFNRCGVPLVEIVSAPDLRSPQEAAEYMRQLRLILRYLGVCDGNMEKGELRCDANVSIRKRGEDKFGTKTEVKNLNSFRFLQRALEYEVARQIELVKRGERVVQETRLWDSTRNETFPMRSKEEAHDYRYFPEPDLVFLDVDENMICEVKSKICEPPIYKWERLQKAYGLAPKEARIFINSQKLADYFEAVAKISGNPKKSANWVLSELLNRLGDVETADEIEMPITVEHLAELIKLVEDGTISQTLAKSVFEECIETKKSPKAIVEEKGLARIDDKDKIERWVDEAIAENPKEVESYRAGKKGLLGFFVGCVMKKSAGKADPKVVNEVLKNKLGG